MHHVYPMTLSRFGQINSYPYICISQLRLGKSSGKDGGLASWTELGLPQLLHHNQTSPQPHFSHT